jgi:hypothetical protein
MNHRSRNQRVGNHLTLTLGNKMALDSQVQAERSPDTRINAVPIGLGNELLVGQVENLDRCRCVNTGDVEVRPNVEIEERERRKPVVEYRGERVTRSVDLATAAINCQIGATIQRNVPRQNATLNVWSKWRSGSERTAQ